MGGHMTDLSARILVVEDNNIVLQDICARLEKLGYAIAGTARSGREAVEKSSGAAPDLVLMDIKLRGEMDGVEAAAIIRAEQDLPVVYLTAYADETTLSRAKITEPFGYILKPFDETTLHTNVQIAISNHRMEKRLRASERWLSTTLRSVGDATVATDAEGRVRFLNPVAEQLTGHLELEAKGRAWTDIVELVHEGSGAAFVADPRNFGRKSVEDRRDLVLVDKNGTEVPVELTATPIVEDDELLGTLLTFRDISERKLAKEALEQSHRLLHLVLEGLQDIIFLKNLEGRFILMNGFGCRLLQLSESEVLGKSDSEIFAPGTANLMSQAHRRAIDEAETQTFECTISSNGEEHTFLVSEGLCRTQSGAPIGVVGIGRDITNVTVDRRPLHQRQKLAETGRAVGELAHEMSRSLEGIQESLVPIKRVAVKGSDYGRQVGEIEDELARIAGLARQLSEIYWSSRSRRLPG